MIVERRLLPVFVEPRDEQVARRVRRPTVPARSAPAPGSGFQPGPTYAHDQQHRPHSYNQLHRVVTRRDLDTCSARPSTNRRAGGVTLTVQRSSSRAHPFGWGHELAGRDERRTAEACDRSSDGRGECRHLHDDGTDSTRVKRVPPTAARCALIFSLRLRPSRGVDAAGTRRPGHALR